VQLKARGLDDVALQRLAVSYTLQSQRYWAEMDELQPVDITVRLTRTGPYIVNINPT